MRHALSYEDGTNGDSALDLLRRHGTRADLRALRAELDAYPRQDSVEAARIAIQSRESPAAALGRLIEAPVHLDTMIEANLLAASTTIQPTRIQAALRSPAASLRQLGLRLLDARSTLRKSDVLEMIENDEEGEVRVLAAELAIKRRWRLSQDQFEKAVRDAPWTFDRHRLGVRFTSLRPAAELTKSLVWYRNTSYWIYEALGRHHFALIADRIATDLGSDFAELREADRHGYVEMVKGEVEAEFERKFEQKPSEENSERIEGMVQASLKTYLEGWAKLDDFILKRFRVAALSALAANPAPEHARWGRQYLSDDNREIASQAVEIIRLCGGPEDVEALRERASNAWRGLREEAARAALHLSEDSRATALGMLGIDDDEVVRQALEALRGSTFDREQVEAIWGLLRDEHPSIREAATEYLIAELPRKQLRGLSDPYSRGQYYYNVVTLIDRALYAPGWVRQSARKILDG